MLKEKEENKKEMQEEMDKKIKQLQGEVVQLMTKFLAQNLLSQGSVDLEKIAEEVKKSLYAKWDDLQKVLEEMGISKDLISDRVRVYIYIHRFSYVIVS